MLKCNNPNNVFKTAQRLRSYKMTRCRRLPGAFSRFRWSACRGSKLDVSRCGANLRTCRWTPSNWRRPFQQQAEQVQNRSSFGVFRRTPSYPQRSSALFCSSGGKPGLDPDCRCSGVMGGAPEPHWSVFLGRTCPPHWVRFLFLEKDARREFKPTTFSVLVSVWLIFTSLLTSLLLWLCCDMMHSVEVLNHKALTSSSFTIWLRAFLC